MRWRDGIIRLPESNCVWLSHFLSSPGPILLGLLGSYIALKWLQGTARSVLGHAAWTSVARHDRHRWDSAEDTQRYLLGMDQRHPFCWELLFERNTRGAENLKQLRLEKKLQAKGHEKMLYITIHEGNANQNHEILPSHLALRSKHWQRGRGEKGTLGRRWWERTLVRPRWKTGRKLLKKLKIQIP